MRLVRDEAWQVLRSLPPGAVQLEDLVGYGHVGLLEARERFDPMRGVPFDAYARHRVRGAIFDGLRALGLMRRRVYEKLRRRVLGERVLGEPREARPSTRAEDARDAYTAITRLAATFLADAALHAEPTPDPQVQLEVRQDVERMRTAVARLDDEERALLRAVYDFDEADDTGAAFARRHGMARSSVTRRHRAVLDKLRAIMAQRERDP